MGLANGGSSSILLNLTGPAAHNPKYGKNLRQASRRRADHSAELLHSEYRIAGERLAGTVRAFVGLPE
jgi:hypothetical protein